MASILSVLSLPAPHISLYSEERQLLCFKLSYKKSSPCLWPTVCKDLRPVNGHRNEFESRSLPGWAFRWLSPWCRLVRDPEPETPSSTPGFLTHRSCEIMHTLCLKVLSFRVICCAAVNNKYNITSSFLVTMILKHNPRKEEESRAENQESSDRLGNRMTASTSLFQRLPFFP